MRWAVLRIPSFYHIRTWNRMILACFLLHNFIRSSMAVDPMEQELGDVASRDPHSNEIPDDYINQVEPSQEWSS
ncbi:hypothetical protein PHJA_001728000 [Phtheirospermum japonicum]|uniref:Uncharacterized protein n=1 Tax=Phtheirospermum japonicum TaxID=374723 RepID=A0A830CFK8_9LAMI|nr:hypothetical protein PHJA_001728000 [Phtheirospermum japonicum]